MKVCVLGDNGSVHIQKWIKAMAAHHKIDLNVISFDIGIKFDRVSYSSLKKFTGTKLDYLLNVFRVRSCIKSIKPDLVHAHYATSYGFLAAYSGFHPLIITGWGADIFDSPKNPLMKKLLINSFRKADAITVLSNITLSEMRKLTNKHIHLIPFGVDVNKFFPQKINSSEIIKIGTIRTLSEKYGIEYLIKAFALLCKKYNNIQLEIVGDGPLRSFLENLAVELRIEKKVIFHGYINQNTEFEKYITLLNRFTIFAIVSILDSETFGVAAVEASACGIPVIATSVGGLPEVVEHGKTGFIVPPKSVPQTTYALEKLITDQNLRITLGNNGRKKVENEYDWNKNVQQMVNLYKKLLNQK